MISQRLHIFQHNFSVFICSLMCLAVLFSGCQDKTETQGPLRIATAANMEYAMDSIAKLFTEETGIRCELVVNSSGMLTAQIRQGAPFDVFVSADLKYPEALHNDGLTLGPPKVYALGRLVLWSLKDNYTPSIQSLKSEEIKHLALANPRTAPYGKAAEEVLQHYAVYDSLAPKLVFGESISQTNQFIVSGAADAGFTSLSVVMSPQMKGKGRWTTFEPVSHAPIMQGVVVLKREQVSDAARKFDTFLFSEQVKPLLRDFGYSVDE